MPAGNQAGTLFVSNRDSLSPSWSSHPNKIVSWRRAGTVLDFFQRRPWCKVEGERYSVDTGCGLLEAGALWHYWLEINFFELQGFKRGERPQAGEACPC